jgi:hypothetical protein
MHALSHILILTQRTRTRTRTHTLSHARAHLKGGDAPDVTEFAELVGHWVAGLQARRVVQCTHRIENKICLGDTADDKHGPAIKAGRIRGLEKQSTRDEARAAAAGVGVK